MSCRVFYEILDPNKIFGMVGRCGGGYNTVWEDWTPTGRIARDHIIKEFEEGLNNICGHYSKLEESILKEGIRNPLVITCGRPVRRQFANLPPELRAKKPEELLLLEGLTGGSRLWVAQKHNIPVPCFINDFTGKFKGQHLVTSVRQAKMYFKDPPSAIKLDSMRGLVESFDRSKVGYHLGLEWSEDRIIIQRAPLWVSLMNKYGYYVDRLQPYVVDILAAAGVVQDPALLKKFNGSGS